MKRVAAVLLSLAMFVSLLCMPVFAASKTCETKEVNIAEWFNALEDARDYFNGGNEQGIVYTYKKTGGKNRTNCAEYVSKAMQLMGWLPEGYNIWLSSTINGRGASYIKSSSDFEIFYPDKATKKCIADGTLQPGDIAGFHTGPGATDGVHTMVYVGDDLWYSYGTSTKNWNTGPLKKGHYDNKKVKVIIRYKNLRITDDHSLKISVKGGTATVRNKEGSSLDLLIAHDEPVQVEFKADDGYILKSAEIDGKPFDPEKILDIGPMRSSHRINVEYEYEYAKYLPADMKDAKPGSGLVTGIDEYTNSTSAEIKAENAFAGIWEDKDGDPEIYEIKIQNNKLDLSQYLKKDGKYFLLAAGEINGKLYAECKSFTYDNTKPEVAIEGIDNKEYTDDIVKLGITLNDKNMEYSDIFVNGTKTQLTNITLEADGKYNILVKAKDKAGNISEIKRDFLIKRPVMAYDTSPEIIINKNDNNEPEYVNIKPSIPGKIILRVYRDMEPVCEKYSEDSIVYRDFGLAGEYELFTYVTDIFGNTKVIRPVKITKE